MNRHLVTVKVRVECRGNQGVQLDRTSLDEYRFESLNAKAVQRWGTVKQYRPFFDDFL